MGAGPSVEIPGGGTEGYHVLRVKILFCTSCPLFVRCFNVM